MPDTLIMTADKQAALKLKVQMLRRKIKAIVEEDWGDISNELLAQIRAHPEKFEPLSDKGKFQFHLNDDVSQGFFDVTRSLHAIWETL